MKRSHWITIPAFSILLTTVACNEKTEPEKEKAATEAKAEVKEAAEPKTKADYEKKLVGKWKLDSDVLKTAMESGMAEAQEDVDPEDPMTEMMAAIMDLEMSFEFSADGIATKTTTVMGEENVEKGEWEITEIDGNILTVAVDGDPGKLNYISDNIIEMILSKEEALPWMKTMTFKRVK